MARVLRLWNGRSRPSGIKGNSRRGWTLLGLSIFGGTSRWRTCTGRVATRNTMVPALWATAGLFCPALRLGVSFRLSAISKYLHGIGEVLEYRGRVTHA